MRLLLFTQGIKEQPGLRKMISKRVRSFANFQTLHLLFPSLIALSSFHARLSSMHPSFSIRRTRFSIRTSHLPIQHRMIWTAIPLAIRKITCIPLQHIHPTKSILLVIIFPIYRPIDRQLMEIRTTQTVILGIHIRENPSLQQRIIRKINSRYQSSRIESRLLRLRKEVLRIPIQGHRSDDLHRHQFLRNDLRWIQNIKRKLHFIFLWDQLHAQIPLWEIALINRIPKITTMKIRIKSGNLLRLIPCHTMYTQSWFPMEFHKSRFPFCIYKLEGMY